LITIVAGALAVVSAGGRVAANLIATAAYVAVTLIFYHLFKPVNRNLSLLAALVSLVGCTLGALTSLNLAPVPISPLVFFGLYCLLIGYLILKSTFLPRILGVLMAIGGLGWLTFLSPTLAASLSPYNMGPGVIGEGALALWLVLKGVDVRKWLARAGVSQLGEA
jgi:hypothetical protein